MLKKKNTFQIDDTKIHLVEELFINLQCPFKDEKLLSNEMYIYFLRKSSVLQKSLKRPHKYYILN